jgi:DNA-binding MarR family transcriptional regulator
VRCEGIFRVLSSIYDNYSMKLISRNAILFIMAGGTSPDWTFLTNHARVLVCIAQDPGARLREVGERVGITERASHRIVAELAAAGYITRQRNGRRNQYTINTRLPMHDPIARDRNVEQLLEVLTRAKTSDAHHVDTHTPSAIGA